MFRKPNLTMIALGLALGSCLTPAHAMMSFHPGSLGTHIASASALRAGPGPLPSRALPTGVGGHLVSRLVSGGINPGKFAVAGQAAKINQIGPAPVTPNVVGRNMTVFGQGGQPNGPGQAIPGVGINPNGPRVNVPGGSTQQTGVRTVPGFEKTTNGPQMNLPGVDNNQHTPNDAQNVINKLTQQQIGIVNQPLGGFNNLNIPTQSARGVDVSDNTGTSKTTTTFTTVTKSVDGYTITTSTYTGTKLTSQVTAIVSQNLITPSPMPGVVQVGTTVSPPSETGKEVSEGVGQAIAEKPGDKPSKPADKPAKPAPGKKNSPDPNDDTTPVAGSGQLDPHSGIARRDQGGGTGNNTETASGKSGTLTPGSAYARKNNGDGSDGRGDNGRVEKGGALAAGTPISRVGEGDGGTADSRGGSGSTQIPATIHGDPAGGVHNQTGMKAAAQP